MSRRRTNYRQIDCCSSLCSRPALVIVRGCGEWRHGLRASPLCARDVRSSMQCTDRAVLCVAARGILSFSHHCFAMSAALPSLAPGAPLVSAPTTSSTSFSGAGPSEPSRLVRRATTSTPSRSRRGDLSAGTVRSTRRLTHFGLGTLHAPLTASPSADEAGLRTPSSATSSLRITNSNSGASSRGASPSAPPPTTPEASSASHSRGETSLSDSISSSAGLHVQLSKEEMALWTDAQAMLEDDVLRGSNRLQRHLAAEPKAVRGTLALAYDS